MNRIDFMKQLESLLQNITPAEREEALQYYNDYFDDAGEENEQEVIEALGNPARVAENIKKDLLGMGYGNAAFDYHTSSNSPGTEVSTTTVPPDTVNADSEKTKLPGWVIVLIVVLAIFAAPIAVGVLGTLIGLLAAWFGLIVASGAVALALFAVFLTLFITGISCIFANPWVGISLVGGGLLCGGLGILFLMLTVAMAGIVTPVVCKGIASLFRKKAA